MARVGRTRRKLIIGEIPACHMAEGFLSPVETGNGAIESSDWDTVFPSGIMMESVSRRLFMGCMGEDWSEVRARRGLHHFNVDRYFQSVLSRAQQASGGTHDE
jgi:hypothetical protein